MPVLNAHNKSPPLPEESLYADFTKDPDWHDHETSTMTTLDSNGGPTAATPDDDVAQISLVQKMLSATGGSILTSLLGWFFCFLCVIFFFPIFFSDKNFLLKFISKQ